MQYQITPYDTARCYVLPHTVGCNVARSGAGYDCGAWHVARGVLVETARATGTRPVSLDYREHLWTCDTRCCPDRVVPGEFVRVEVRAELDPTDRPGPLVVECAWWGPTNPREARHEGWSLTVDGTTVAGEDRPRVPTPPCLAMVVRLHLRGW